MSASTPITVRKASRLLAALDGPEVPLAPVTPQLYAGGVKRAFDDEDNAPIMPGGIKDFMGSNKRRATGLGLDRANILATPGSSGSAAVDVEMMSQLLGRTPSTSQTRAPGALGASGLSFRINYDQETSVKPIDIGGADQNLRMAEFVTRTIDNSSHGLTVQKAMENLGLRDKKDLIPGMEVRLLPHQIIGVSWMIDQECKSRNRGGILADDMGLGKTVQMIATMVINQPKEEDKARTTLIIVPAALLLQWKEELDSKTNEIFNVHIQHGKDKLKSVSALQSKDAIITTYQTLNMDFGVPDDINPDEEMEWLAENGGVLARMKWYRIITDEAQFIRNRATRSSKAVAMLRARYRWCLTGTPVTNTLADIYGLLRFGHFRPWNDWGDFNEYIAKTQLEDAPLAGLRAQEVLKPLLLRRTKNSELEGRPLLELPPKDIELVKVDFSDEEREVYDAFEKRAQIRINKYIRERTIVKNIDPPSASTLLPSLSDSSRWHCLPHRLVECRTSFAALQSQTDGFEDPTLMLSGEAEKELARASKVMGAKWVHQVKQRFLERAKTSKFDWDDEMDADEATCPNCGDLFVNDSGRVLGCGHEICFDCSLDLSNAPPAHDGIFGQGDEQANLRIEKDFEAAVAKGLRPCPTCKKMNDMRASHVFKSSAFEPSEEEFKSATKRAPSRVTPSRQASSSGPARKSPAPKVHTIEDIMDLSSSSDEELPDVSTLLMRRSSSPKAKVKKNVIVSDDEDNDGLDLTIDKHRKKAAEQKKGKAYTGNHSTGELNQALVKTWRKGDSDMEPSAKMMALVHYLKEWDSTGDKTIVYSQWTSMLDLIETLFSRYGIQNLRYDGKMNREAREAVLARFRKSGGPRVMLISTKCGGVGLNLVSANRVINMDLSWNYASESQAYDRVHRLGQEKDVTVKRLVVRNTIEDRMLQLQETKTGLAEAALGEGNGIKLHKLSVKQLKALFGMNHNNGNGTPGGSQ
ncbi:unnamed protein product [Somion occarium]|uniref:Uncharacterized protein n=1 Tax=Somion occarium TaxID=3059160 RepID=A0ABP1CSW8_9APHY